MADDQNTQANTGDGSYIDPNNQTTPQAINPAPSAEEILANPDILNQTPVQTQPVDHSAIPDLHNLNPTETTIPTPPAPTAEVKDETKPAKISLKGLVTNTPSPAIIEPEPITFAEPIPPTPIVTTNAETLVTPAVNIEQEVYTPPIVAETPISTPVIPEPAVTYTEPIQVAPNPIPEPITIAEPIQVAPNPIPEPITIAEPIQVAPNPIPEPITIAEPIQVTPEPIPPNPVVTTNPETPVAPAANIEQEVYTPPVVTETAATEPIATDPETANPKEEKKKPKKKKKSKILLFVLIGILISVLSAIGIGVMMLATKDNPGGSALFTALGIETPSLMTFVFLVSSIVLGIFALIAFIVGLVSLFKLKKTDKTNKSAKKKRLLSLILSFFLMFLFLIGSVFASFNIKKYSIGPVQNLEVIISDPVETIGLTTPVDIDFKVANLPIDPAQVEIIGYIWEFGDGERGSGEQIKHTFKQKPADGIYNVTLTIQYKENGKEAIQTETYTKTVSIENEAVSALFTIDPSEGRVPLEVIFDASESFDPDGEIVMYEWDFDGNGDFEGEGEVTTYTYETAGEYEASLRLTDSNGAQTTSSQTIKAKGEDIISFDLTIDPDDEILSPNLAYQFDASSSKSDEGNIKKYEWNFGDTNIGDGQKVSHSYETEGVYTITTTLTDEADNVRSFETEIKVSNSGSGLFARIQTVPEINQKNKTILGTAPFKVNFSGGNSSGGDIIGYEWDFNSDGETDSSGKTVEHVFDQAGTYNVFLKIKSADDKEATETITIEVESSGLQAKINVNPATGVVPISVTFDASDSSKPADVEIVSYQWDFADGTPVNKSGNRVTHRYDTIGTFTPSLLIIDSENNFSKVETVIHVNSIPLEACYTLSRRIGKAPLFVEFNPVCSSGSIASYRWDFAGLGASDKIKPDFTFKVPGTYEIKLEVSDKDNNLAEFSETVIVE